MSYYKNYKSKIYRPLAIVLVVVLSIAPLMSVTVKTTLAAPTAPSAPSSPSSPDEPEAPSAPESPDSPEAPDAPLAPSVEDTNSTDEEVVQDEADPQEDSSPINSNNSTGSESPTGESSGNSSTVVVPDETTLSPETNVSGSGGLSGDNKMGDVAVETGDASGDVILSNLGNLNASNVSSGSGSDVTIINDGNGTHSTNSADVGLTTDNLLSQTNEATVKNDINEATVTGSNSASRNTGGDVSLETGDANASATVINALNTNVAGLMVSEFNVVDDQLGDIVLDFSSNCIAGCGGSDFTAKNTGNGSNSTNDISAGMVDSSVTFQSNSAEIDNEILLAADSGRNNASDNTGGDVTIQTGDASLAASSFNFANTNIAGNAYLGVVNIYGNLVGDIILPEAYFSGCDCGSDTFLANLGNGSSSTNTIDANSSSSDEIFQFNEALITNELVLDAQTGLNSASDNTGGNIDVETGDASAKVGILNIANTNLIGGDWWLVLVNKAGEWVGQILGAPDGSTVAGSAGTLFGLSESGELTAVNSGNGSDSDNTIDVNEEDSSVISQENRANIDNKMNLSANTGRNSANANTGGNVKIDTGDADIVANIVNFVNTNIVGTGRLFVTVVNVFGSWVGDFVTPGNEKKTDTLAQNDAPPVGGLGEEASSESSEEEDDDPVVEAASREVSDDSEQASESEGDDSGNGGNKGSFLGITSTPSSGGPFAGLIGGGSAGEVLAANSNEVPATSPADTSETNSNKVVNINLAWLLLLLPLLPLYRFRGSIIEVIRGARAHVGA